MVPAAQPGRSESGVLPQIKRLRFAVSHAQLTSDVRHKRRDICRRLVYIYLCLYILRAFNADSVRLASSTRSALESRIRPTICIDVMNFCPTKYPFVEHAFFVCIVSTCCCCCCCCCCLHIKSRSGLYSVLSNIRTGPTDADAFRGHRLTTQKGYTYQKEIKGPRKVNTHAIV